MAEPVTPERETKKRRRGALADLQENSRDAKCARSSLKTHTSPTNPNNLQPRTLDQMKKTWVSRHRQGCNLSTAHREIQFDYLEDNELFEDRSKLLPGMAAKRRETFALFYYQYFGSPSRDKWAKCVAYIARILLVPDGSRDSIYRVFEDCEYAESNDASYSSSSNASKAGRHRLIVDGTEEANIIYAILEQGLGSTAATFVVNAYFTRKEINTVSLHAVKNFIKGNPCIIITRNTGGKSGKDDVSSTWAECRMAQCLQYLEQMRLGKLPAGAPLPDDSPPPYRTDGIVWWDEKHFAQRLGVAGKHQTRVSRNAAGNVAPPREGGVFRKLLKNMTMKFPGDARLVFGVAVRTRHDGEQEGIRCEPYSYTGKTVVGVARFDVEIEKEFHRARGLKGVWGQVGGGYQGRYGLEARTKCIEQVSKKLVCITTIMDHVVSESKKVYEGTSRFDDFCIFHDGLSQWC
jgi:hypothetical protein